MLDLGTSFLASVERDPKALAIVDGDVRLTYDAWYVKISSLVAARTLSVPKPLMQYRAPTPTRGRSCFIPRARPLAPKACPGVTAPSALPLSPMWRRISIATANARWV
jgi:hypothetical protein